MSQGAKNSDAQPDVRARFQMSDEQWMLLTEAGRLVLKARTRERYLLDPVIEHFQLSKNESQGSARTSEVVAAMESIASLAKDLQRKIRSHPEVRTRLTGIVWFLTGDEVAAIGALGTRRPWRFCRHSSAHPRAKDHRDHKATGG